MTTPSFNVPKISFDFTNASLSSLITFSRSGNTATVVNSSGFIQGINADLPRFDYDPISLACRGFLIEGASTNIFPYSNDFSFWNANTNLTVSAGASTGPDNTASMSRMTETATSVWQRSSIFVTLTAGVTYTYTIFAKADSRSILQMMTGGQFGQGYANFDLSSGTVVLNSNANAVITPFGNGIFRCQITLVANNSANDAVYFGPQLLPAAARAAAYQGDGTSGLFVYGAQLEVGPVTSYIPTSGSSLTRNADVATITGTNFSDFWQASKGGAQVQAIPSTVSGIRPLVQYDDGTANEIIALRGNTTNPELYIVDGGTPQAQLDAGTIAANTAYSLTGWWQTNDCKARQNSGAVVTDNAATIPTVTQARLGSDGTNYLNGHLASISYYDTFSGQIYTRRKNKVIFNLM
jgi:hypothetical protein